MCTKTQGIDALLKNLEAAPTVGRLARLVSMHLAAANKSLRQAKAAHASLETRVADLEKKRLEFGKFAAHCAREVRDVIDARLAKAGIRQARQETGEAPWTISNSRR